MLPKSNIKKASNKWSDAPYFRHYTEKSSSDVAQSRTNDDVDDSESKGKDRNKIKSNMNFNSHYIQHGSLILGSYFHSAESMAYGGELLYGNILNYSKEKRIEMINKILREKEYISTARGDFDLLSKKANEFIEKYFPFNKSNPIISKYHKIYFEPLSNKKSISSQIRYVLHFITSDTKDKKNRIFDRSKVNAIQFLLSVILQPDQTRLQSNNKRIVYIKKFEFGKKHCCAILSAELSLDGNVTAITILPDQTEDSIKRKEASNHWINTPFPSRFTPKLPSDETISNISGSINDTDMYGKDTYISDINNKKEINFSKGGTMPQLGQSKTLEQARKVIIPIYNELEAFDPDLKIAYHKIDWGAKKRGQGRRTGSGMVTGSMSAAPVGIKKYSYIDLSQWSKDEPADDFKYMQYAEPYLYAKGRMFGLNHYEAKVFSLMQPPVLE